MSVLEPSMIPECLWHGSVLRLPESVEHAYEQVLTSEGLLQAAQQGHSKSKVYGGASQEESQEHFAFRFGNSAGRAEFASLAPKGRLRPISDALISAFSTGRVALLDLPCGAGASASAFVATIACLRENEVLPRLPLTIHITGGDISEYSLYLFDMMMNQIRSKAIKQAIELTWSKVIWDGTSSDDTAKIIDHWLAAAPGAEEHVVCVSNFSGALQQSGAFNAFSPCFDHIVARMHDKRATIAWIEPSTMRSVGKMFNRLRELVASRFPGLLTGGSKDVIDSDEYAQIDSITGKQYQTGVSVLHLMRTG